MISCVFTPAVSRFKSRFSAPQKTLPAVHNACKSGFFRQKSGKGP